MTRLPSHEHSPLSSFVAALSATTRPWFTRSLSVRELIRTSRSFSVMMSPGSEEEARKRRLTICGVFECCRSKLPNIPRAYGKRINTSTGTVASDNRNRRPRTGSYPRDRKRLNIKVRDYAYSESSPSTCAAPTSPQPTSVLRATEIFDQCRGIAEFVFRLRQAPRTYPIQGKTLRRLLDIKRVSTDLQTASSSDGLGGDESVGSPMEAWQVEHCAGCYRT